MPDKKSRQTENEISNKVLKPLAVFRLALRRAVLKNE